jgi:arylsulfatase/uncharacterized sulfatase
MMEAADFHLGRLLEHLETKGRFDKTIIVVTSDNGPEYNTLGKTSAPATRAFENLWMTIEGWDVNYENLGQPGSMAAIGHEWASVSAAPFHLFKFNTTEGGLRVPMVISGPGIENLGIVEGRSQVADITPTLLDLAGVTIDPGAFHGRSWKPLLEGRTRQVYGDADAMVFEVSGAAAVYRGDWKITRTLPPYGDGQWHLYDLASDPGETTDLADQHPAVFQAMINEYQAYAEDVGVFEMAPGESARKQLVVNAMKGTAVNYWHLIAAVVVGFAALLYLARRAVRGLFRPGPR